MAKQSKQTFKSLGVSRTEAENIRAALALLEETKKKRRRKPIEKARGEPLNKVENWAF